VRLSSTFAAALASYYDFADQRTLLGIPNFWNVVSNLPFAVVGWIGLRAARNAAWRLLFAGVFLTAFGSAYFHFAPRDATLVWDRIPMTLVFMSLLAIVLGDEFGQRWRNRLLWPLAACGVASVLWWYWTGNVLPYGLVQFGPILLVLAVMYSNPRVRKLWPSLALYALAKIAETFDKAFYDALLWSGHTWKHLLAAAASYWIYRWYGYLSDQTASSLPLGSVK
jgi:hypothetical protein